MYLRLLAVLLFVSLVVGSTPVSADGPIAVSVHPGTAYGRIHKDVLGVNSSTRYDGAATMRELAQSFAQLGVTGSRWPGGTLSDVFDWRDPSPRYCSFVKGQPAETDGAFDAYMHDLVIPNGLSPELTVNYATAGLPACSGPGDPKLAADWVRYANITKHYAVKWWEVGNETYEPGEPDNHADAHTPESYSENEPAFYAAMKAIDPTIRVGIPVTAGAHSKPAWDGNVLANAKFDYVAFHYYPTFYPHISDDRLLDAPTKGSFAIQPIIRNLRAELVRAGKCSEPCSMPISISEWNSVSHNPTSQTMTIVEGLFAAETLGEFFNAGVARAEFWVDHGCQDNTPGRSGYNTDPEPSVYGWQHGTGNQGLLSASGIPDALLCPHAPFTAPAGSVFPSGRALQLYAQSGFATDGASAVAVESGSESIKPYASYDSRTHQVVVFLINLDASHESPVKISIDGLAAGSECRSIVYSKSIYDRTKDDGPWDPPATKSLGPWKLPLQVTVPPWSMAAYTFRS